MFTRPDDLSDEAVGAALTAGWGLTIDRLDYAPVGFGSHHWHLVSAGTRWFVTIDDLELGRQDASDRRSAVHDRLVAALGTAAALRSGGCDAVVAPTASHAGRLVEPVTDRYVVALYPHVDGTAGSFGPFERVADRLAVVDCLATIHGAEADVPAGTDDLSIPWHDALVGAIDERSGSWSAGPYAQPTWALLDRHREPLRAVLGAYEELSASVRARAEPLVVTHGEPHAGNVIITDDGPRLIDWDTTLLAPPERDLWNLIQEDPQVRDHYEHRAGRGLDDRALRLYRLWWDLCEISLYVQDFRQPHRETADTRTAWRGLERHLDPARWVDVIGSASG